MLSKARVKLLIWFDNNNWICITVAEQTQYNEDNLNAVYIQQVIPLKNYKISSSVHVNEKLFFLSNEDEWVEVYFTIIRIFMWIQGFSLRICCNLFSPLFFFFHEKPSRKASLYMYMHSFNWWRQAKGSVYICLRSEYIHCR